MHTLENRFFLKIGNFSPRSATTLGVLSARAERAGWRPPQAPLQSPRRVSGPQSRPRGQISALKDPVAAAVGEAAGQECLVRWWPPPPQLLLLTATPCYLMCCTHSISLRKPLESGGGGGGGGDVRRLPRWPSQGWGRRQSRTCCSRGPYGLGRGGPDRGPGWTEMRSG